MSWDKNTTNDSEIDSVVKTLRELGVPYELKVLGTVAGFGLNDLMDFRDDGSELNRNYDIRLLTYGNRAIVEQMVRHTDCDMDDVIESHRYDAALLPSIFQLEITVGNEIKPVDNNS